MIPVERFLSLWPYPPSLKQHLADRSFRKIELKRVMIHGVLHLCGHKDKTKEEEENMRSLENKYLN